MLAVFAGISMILATLVFGVFWGPWLALTRSMSEFGAEVFLAIVHRMDRNLAPAMTVLMPAALASITVVVVGSFPHHRSAFYLSLGALLSFALAAVVTMTVEVPIVARIRGWTVVSMPADWTAQRDRWMRFHLIRVGAGFLTLLLLVLVVAVVGVDQLPLHG